MNQKKVSIILPTYNRVHILHKSIDSVRKQTYPHWELLVVDDGSTDDTKTLVESYQDGRIRYMTYGDNRGVAAARNYGIAQASYDYIAFQDSDDVWRPDKLEKQMEALRQAGENTGFCYHAISYEKAGEGIVVVPSELIPADRKNGDIFAQMLWSNLVACPSVLAKRECIDATQCFDTQMKALEDYDLALQMSRSYQAVFLDEVLLEAGCYAEGVSANPANHLLASLYLLRKWKADYLATGTFNHRIETILRNAEMVGKTEEIVRLMELMLTT